MLEKYLNNDSTIAIVGNGPINKDWSEEIDSADCVIRFSTINNFHTGLAGTKTDILVVRPERNAISKDYILELKNIKYKQPFVDCKELLCVGANVTHMKKHFQYLSEQIVELKNKPTTNIYINRLYQYMVGKYYQDDIQSSITCGLVVVLYILHSTPFYVLDRLKIKLFGFNYDGFDGCNELFINKNNKKFIHNIKREKEIVQDLDLQGYIEIYN